MNYSKPPPSRARIWIARLIALAADGIQLGLFPLFASGGAFPADDVLDVAVAIVMVWLLGWHWAFLPAIGAELVPMLDLVPTWTAAVWIVTRSRGTLRNSAALDPLPLEHKS